MNRKAGAPAYGFAVQDGQLVPLPAEQRIIADTLKGRQLGLSFAAMATAFNDAGVPTKLGGRWDPKQLKRLVAAHGPVTPAERPYSRWRPWAGAS